VATADPAVDSFAAHCGLLMEAMQIDQRLGLFHQIMTNLDFAPLFCYYAK
jgi:hypothetical protein